MKKHLFFILLAILLLTPWPVAYAYDTALAGVEPMQVAVTPAPDTAVPSYSVYGRAIGGVAPGDLFYVDAADDSADMVVTLYVTNADERSRC